MRAASFCSNSKYPHLKALKKYILSCTFPTSGASGERPKSAVAISHPLDFFVSPLSINIQLYFDGLDNPEHISF